jgi:hypothetical protein
MREANGALAFISGDARLSAAADIEGFPVV